MGPIPVEDGIGKEVVAKLSTDVKSNKKFYTDSNGRDFIERVSFSSVIHLFGVLIFIGESVVRRRFYL